MTATRIFAGAEAAKAAMFDARRHIHTNVVATGEHMQLVWARYEPQATYSMHTHSHEQFSVLLQGRMRLTVGEEVREIGPGDMWHAPANVPHGGEIVGEEAVVFVDIYGPPSGTILDYVEWLRGGGTDDGGFRPEVGRAPSCHSPLAGESRETPFLGFSRWGGPPIRTRVFLGAAYPPPRKARTLFSTPPQGGSDIRSRRLSRRPVAVFPRQ